jgi:hypothetical protein
VLTVELVNGNRALNNPHELLSSGALVWLENDHRVHLCLLGDRCRWPCGARSSHGKIPPPSVPGAHEPGPRAPGWRPLFLDYLYLGLTNATAFSPTDVMPLRHWAKLTMGVQALISLIILGLSSHAR